MPLKTETLKITPEVLTLVAEIDEFKGAWRALGMLAPDRLVVLRREALIESIGSSTRIEGSRLSDDDVARLLATIDTRSFDFQEEQGVAGYARLVEALYANFGEIELSEEHIMQMHAEMLIFSNQDASHRGAYKTHANHVRAFDKTGKDIGMIFKTATPYNTPNRMKELVEWTHAAFDQQTLHPLLIISIFTVVFLEIHPFQDGNGRLSRVLTTFLLMRCGYAYVPCSSMDTVIENSKEHYYLALQHTQKTIRSTHPDWQPWTIYFLRALQQQKRHLEEKIEHERQLVSTLPGLSLKIIDSVKESGCTTIGEIVTTTGANRNTVKKHLARLVDARQLTRYGMGKGAWYGQ